MVQELTSSRSIKGRESAQSPSHAITRDQFTGETCQRLQNAGNSEDVPTHGEVGTLKTINSESRAAADRARNVGARVAQMMQENDLGVPDRMLRPGSMLLADKTVANSDHRLERFPMRHLAKHRQCHCREQEVTVQERVPHDHLIWPLVHDDHDGDDSHHVSEHAACSSRQKQYPRAENVRGPFQPCIG